MSSLRFGSGGFVAYYNIVVCPPESWSPLSLATLLFVLFAAQGSLVFPLVMGEAIVRYQPFSLKCKVGSTRPQWVMLILTVIVFYVGSNTVLVPTMLKCSSQTYSTTLIGVMLLNNIMGSIDQLLAMNMIFTWCNDIVYNGKAILDKIPTHEDIKEIICQYEVLRYAVERFIFSIYLSLQLLSILVFYVGTEGMQHVFISNFTKYLTYFS